MDRAILHNPTYHLLARLETGVSRWIVGLAGVPGSGKSTLAGKIAAEVNRAAGAGAIIALGMDGFHLSKEQLRQRPDAEAALARRGAPWTFDPQALAERLLQVRRAAGREAVGWPDFQHDIGDPVENGVIVPPEARLILVEGLYLLSKSDGWEAVGACLDERWYLDTPMEVAMERLASRHVAAWGVSRSEAEARIAANDRLNAELVLQSRDNADWQLV